MAGSTATLKGSAACQWGIGEEVGFGRIMDIEQSDEIVTDPIETQEGAVDGLVIYDGHKNLSATVMAGTGGSAPAAGSDLSVGGTSYLLTKSTKVGSHKGKVMIRVEGIKHNNMDGGGGGGGN